MSAAPTLEEELLAMDDRADLLAAVRRADWRFLLPDPSLGRVAYLAPHLPDVVVALQEVAAAVDLLDTVDATRPDYDVVVITGGRIETVATARALLRSGGWVCAEVRGRQAGRAARTLRASGFEAIEASWLWPNAGACREMVPLVGPALREALGRRDPGGRLRARVRLAQALARTPLIRLAVRSAVVVGRTP